MVVVPSRLNPGLSLGEIVVSQLAVWLPWAGWSLLVTTVADRVPLQRGHVAKAIAVHVPLCVLVVTGQILIVDRVSLSFGVVPERALDSILAYGLRSYGDLFTVIYWAILGAHAAMRWHEAWRAEAVRAARLSSDLAQAQLAALRAQLQPHFLFNALNAVVALVSEDPPAAKRVTVRLAELLRATLAATERSSLPLREELELTRRYLDIEQVRFAERLRVEWSVDADVLDCEVPAFVLQPLVENALVHAIARAPRVVRSPSVPRACRADCACRCATMARARWRWRRRAGAARGSATCATAWTGSTTDAPPSRSRARPTPGLGQRSSC